MHATLNADTVIFYDADLNPSMDARTQKWCDKIGRSKDVHIYRSDTKTKKNKKCRRRVAVVVVRRRADLCPLPLSG